MAVEALQHVWLPSARCWACLSSSSDLPGVTSSACSSMTAEEKWQKTGVGQSDNGPRGQLRKRGNVEFPSSEVCAMKKSKCGSKSRAEGNPEVDCVGVQSEDNIRSGGMATCTSSSMCNLEETRQHVQKTRNLQRNRLRSNVDTESRKLPTGFESDAVVVSSSQESMCAICLGNIKEERGAVLWWCMHKFCRHCIEEWSRVRRVCPLCKAEFSGWFFNIQGTGEFEERVLAPVAREDIARDNATNHTNSRTRPWGLGFQRGQGRGRVRQPFQLRLQNSAYESRPEALGRLVPFPTQRSFGSHAWRGTDRERVEELEAVRMRWRSSIYEKGLKARRFNIKGRAAPTKATLHDPDAKARADRRLKPWIHRELRVLLRDPDPSLLVHFVLSLWFRFMDHLTNTSQEKSECVSQSSRGNIEVENAAEVVDERGIKDLERFLGDKASTFWHELRCFADSPFTMNAYDSVVVYNEVNVPASNERNEFHKESGRKLRAGVRQRQGHVTSSQLRASSDQHVKDHKCQDQGTKLQTAGSAEGQANTQADRDSVIPVMATNHVFREASTSRRTERSLLSRHRKSKSFMTMGKGIEGEQPSSSSGHHFDGRGCLSDDKSDESKRQQRADVDGSQIDLSGRYDRWQMCW